MENKPIKRHIALQPLSREHHHGLLLCWKIKTGFKRNISTQRIKSYTDWFWVNYLSKHFANEEKYLFPILGNENEYVLQAMSEHKNIQQLFEQQKDIDDALKQIENKLEKHIRFEERTLFNAIQSIATAEQLQQIHLSEEQFTDNLIDAFWI